MNDLPLDINARDTNPEGSRLALEQFLQQQDTESALTQYIQVLVRQKWIVLSIIAAGLLAAVFINATTVKLYRSVASLQVAREAARVVNTDDGIAKGGSRLTRILSDPIRPVTEPCAGRTDRRQLAARRQSDFPIWL